MKRFLRLAPVGALTVLYVGCGDGEATRGARATVTLDGDPPPINYTVPGLVPPIAQPSDNVCWAAATTIMMSWKRNTVLGVDAAMAQLGAPYPAMFRANEGLERNEKNDLLRKAGLRAEAPQNYTAAGWESLLRRFGPLWVTTDEGYPGRALIHARILVGIQGDGTLTGTRLTLVNPDGGRTEVETLQDFARKFEQEAVREAQSQAPGQPRPPHRVQVLHW